MDTHENNLTSSATILVVEDSSMNQMLIEIMLRRLNYNVIITSSGIEALDLLEKSHIDLVLSDIMMPEMNGYELLERIRTSKNLCHLPVVMMTAGGRASLSDKAVRMGADGFLSHPFSSIDLHQMINRFTGPSQSIPAPVSASVSSSI